MQNSHLRHRANDCAYAHTLQAVAARGGVHEMGQYTRQGVDFSDEVVARLQGRGLLEARTAPDGGKEIAVKIAAVRWDCFVACRDPAIAATATPSVHDVCRLAKLDLIAMLHRQGFTGTTDRAALSKAWVAGSSCYKLQNVTGGPKPYFACLVRRDAIVAKGATSILHSAPTVQYYWLLLHLKDLRPLQALVDSGELTAARCEEMTSSAPAFPLATETLAIEDGVPVEPPAPLPVPVIMDAHAAEAAMLAPAVLPSIPHKSGAVPVVHFDNCSHQSGVMRGWIKCVWHPGCQKWRQVNVSGTKARTVAYLHAWLLAGHGISQIEHASLVVSDDVMLEHLARYPDGDSGA